MKLVPLRTGVFNSCTIFLEILGKSTTALAIDELRKRVRVIEQVEKSVGSDKLILEDADHQCLKDALSSAPFTVAHKELLQIIDDVRDARDPPEVPHEIDLVAVDRASQPQHSNSPRRRPLS